MYMYMYMHIDNIHMYIHTCMLYRTLEVGSLQTGPQVHFGGSCGLPASKTARCCGPQVRRLQLPPTGRSMGNSKLRYT